LEGFRQCISNKGKFGYRPVYKTRFESKFPGEKNINKENWEHYTRHFKWKKDWSSHYEMKEKACDGQRELYSTGE